MRLMNALRGATIGWRMSDSKKMVTSALSYGHASGVKHINIDNPEYALDGTGKRGGLASRQSIALEGFVLNAVVHRCARLIADACADVPFSVMKDGKAIKDHPVIAKLDNPQGASGEVDGRDLLNGIYTDLSIYGEAFFVSLGVGFNNLTALDRLRPDRMTERLGKNGQIIGWYYQIGSGDDIKKRYFAKKRVLHVKLHNPLNDYRGLSPVQSCAWGVNIHNGINKATMGLMNNQGRPAGALVYKNAASSDTLSESQFERVKHELDSMMKDASNAGSAMLLEGGLDWKAMGYSPVEAAHLDMAMKAAREIALAMGVPPMLLGIPGDNTYSNYQEAQRAFYRQTIAPFVRKVLSRLTAWLIWQPESLGGGDLLTRLVADWLSVPVIAQDRRDQMKEIDEISFMTIEEKREAVGLPLEPKHGKIIVPGNNFTLEQILNETGDD
jgi:HK97 family phage portal protein